mgnify:CR=1 FL=1
MTAAPPIPQPPTSGLIAQALGAQLIGPPDLPITSVDAIDKAKPGALTFIRERKFADRWAASKASVALVSRGVEVKGHDPQTRALIVVDDADLAIAALLKMFAPPAPQREPGIHPSAVVHPSATIAPTAHVGPLCVVSEGAVIGERTTLVAQCHIGAGVRIGADCTIHPHVTILDRCTVGDRCIFWPGVRIGADGFGYRPDPKTGSLVKIPHIGAVAIGNDVEIGANTCIDRGKFGPTVIGDGSKIDNLCQLGHNVAVGRSVIICGLAGIAGSVTIEDGAVIAGHVGIADGLTIGAKSIVSAKAGVVSDVPPGQIWFGTPAGPHKEQMRAFAALRKLSEHLRTIKKLEKLEQQGKLPDLPAEADDTAPTPRGG